MQTRITELFGIPQPIVQGGMAWIADARLAAAVTNGGGLGVIACGSLSPDQVREQIHRARTLTDGPIGVNIMLMSPHASELAAMLAEERVDVVTTGAGSPAPYMDAWKAAGIKVAPVVASVALAKKMERCGADAVIAEGCEAGGHIGELTTMALTPAVADAVTVPVITAGGVADGRGMAAAFALGAEGVQVGTRFLAASECRVAASYKDKVIAAKDSDTVVTGRFGGHPVRGLKNPFARRIRSLENDPSVSAADMEGIMAGSLRRAVEGDVKGGSIMAGQVACLVHEELPAARIIADMVAQAESWGACGLEQMAARNAARSWSAQGGVR